MEDDWPAEYERLIPRLDAPDRSDLIRLSILVFVVAFGIRAGFALSQGTATWQPRADAQEYSLTALGIADGHGYSRLEGDLQWHPSAFRPPITPYLVATVYEFDRGNTYAARLALSAFGAGSCVLVLFIGGIAFAPARRGWTVGTLAAFGCAGWPMLVMYDTSILTEPVHVFLVLAGVLLVLRSARPARVPTLAALGAITGLVSLNRPDGPLYALLALLWAAGIVSRAESPALSEAANTDDTNDAQPEAGARRRKEQSSAALDVSEAGNDGSRTGQRRAATARCVAGLRPAAVVALAFALVMSPWWIRNAATFGTFVPTTTSGGEMLTAANNEATYGATPFRGYWAYQALMSGESGAVAGEDELTRDRVRRRVGLSYIASHPIGFAKVMFFRVARGWELYDPAGNARFGEAWGRPFALGIVATLLYYPVLALALASLIQNRRRWRELAPLYAIPLLVTASFALFYGEARFRAAAEPLLLVLAADRLLALWAWAASRRPGRQAVAAET